MSADRTRGAHPSEGGTPRAGHGRVGAPFGVGWNGPRVAKATVAGLVPLFGTILLLAAFSLACSVGQAVVGRDAAVQPTASKTPRATFTPLPTQEGLLPGQVATPAIRGTLPPGVSVIAPANGTPGAGGLAGSGNTSLILIATETPDVSPTPTLGEPGPGETPDVETNRPTREAGPRALPTPYVVINQATLVGRRGPGTSYDRIGQATKGDELFILAKNAAGTWLQVCCMANQPVWVAADQVTTKGPVELVPPVLPPPTNTPVPPRPRPTPAPATPIPLPPFDVARGPEFPIQRDNDILTIWVKVYEGSSPYEKPVSGYILKVFRDGIDVSDNAISYADRPFDKTTPEEGAYEYNLKFEMRDAGEAAWRVFLARPGGFPVSRQVEFTTLGDSYRNLTAYLAFLLAR